MSIDERLRAIIRCPVCLGTLDGPDEADELVCTQCGRRYPVRNDVPVLLADEATGGPDHAGPDETD